MPKRSSRPKDINQLAKVVVGLATGDAAEIPMVDGKNAAAVALGRLGGQKGGRARADKLSPAKRKQIAKKAAETRWAARVPKT